MKKVVIITARYGSGHHTVCNNIYEHIKNNENFEVEKLDLTKYANLFGRISFKFFDFIIQKRPELLFNASYELIDHKIVTRQQKRVVKLFFDNKKLRKKINKINPEVILATHYYGATLGVLYNDLKITNAKIATILTDYSSHAEWLSYHAKKDAFIVANDIVKNELIEYGIEKKKIHALGIPIEKKKIHNLIEKEEVYKNYKLDKTKKTILFFGGSSAGSLTYYPYFKSIAKLEIDANIIFISGKNEELRKKSLDYAKKHERENIKVLGYSTDIYNLLNIVDFVITKPGGATITECMEFNVPMLLIPGFGGQEKYNQRYIKDMNYGVFARSKIRFTRYIKEYLEDKHFLLDKKKALQKRKKINSIELIEKLILKL